MRIAVIGANGQVGAEVSLLLARQAGVEVRAVSRTRNGSAFLRYAGLSVAHGEISDPARAPALLKEADVIANFALAIGTPAASLANNAKIVTRIFECAPPGATIVFFSTLAVNNRGDGAGGMRSPYEKSKLKTEKLALDLAAKMDRKLYILRLGHVAGELQNIVSIWRDELKSQPIRIPDPDRDSNVTYTAAIAEALVAIAEGRAGPPGRYDLVNTPQWTWRQIYEHEAAKMGLPVSFKTLNPIADNARPGVLARLKGLARAIAGQPRVRQMLERVLALLPVEFNERAKATYSVGRMRAEIADLSPPATVRNSAALWIGLPVRLLDGARPTVELLRLPEFQFTDQVGPRWPADAS